MLEQAVRDGVMTREHAEKVDAWAEDLAKRQTRGDVTEEEVGVIVRAKAVCDALDMLGDVPGVVIIVGPEEDEP